MKRFTLLSRPLAHSKIVSWAREMSAVKAWAFGVGIAGGVALLSVSAGAFGNFITGNDTNVGGHIAGLPNNDESLVRAVYAAGMVQDLGTFAGYQAAAAASGRPEDFAAGVASTGDASDILSLQPGGVRANRGANIDFNGKLWGESALALAATHQSFRSPSGPLGGRGGGGGVHSSGGGSNTGGGSGSAASAEGGASSAHSAGGSEGFEAKGEFAFAAGSKDEEKTDGFSAMTGGGNEAAALLADEVWLGAGGGAGAAVPEGLPVETIATPDSHAAIIETESDALLGSALRVPEVATTWALFGAALASFAILRRVVRRLPVA